MACEGSPSWYRKRSTPIFADLDTGEIDLPLSLEWVLDEQEKQLLRTRIAEATVTWWAA